MSVNQVGARGGPAVVLGASLTGLLAARVLADAYQEVVLVERDRIEPDAGPVLRPGVPQTGHSHGLLAGGTEALDRLLPGLYDGLVADGAVSGRAEDAAWRFAGHRPALGVTQLRGLCASRALIESHVRRRVLALPGVRVLDQHDVVAPTTVAAGHRVTGVQVHRRTDDRRTVLPADLVVDATGRGSRTPAWLRGLGLTPPPEETCQVGITYVTRRFRRSTGAEDVTGGLMADVIGTDPPHEVSGVLLANEHGLWSVTIAGYFGQRPATDLDGFRAWAQRLGGALAAVVASCPPVGEALTFSFPRSRWRHYERCRDLPAGLVVIGDAVASFNPVYGQGMTSAALQVEALQHCLRRTTDPQELPLRVARAGARVVAAAWQLAVGLDERFPQHGPRPRAQRLADAYLDRVLARIELDPALAESFLRVISMLDPPATLFAPRQLRRVLLPSHRTSSVL